jgi:hypothetical protein
MASLIEGLQELETKLAILRDANAERDTLQGLRVRRQKVAAAKAGLDDALTHFAIVERLASTAVGKPRVSSQLRSKPAGLKEQLEAGSYDVSDNQQWDSTLATPLQAFSTKVEEWSLETWQTHIDKSVPPVRDEVLEQLERLGFGARVREVRAARDQIRNLRARLPREDATLNAVLDLNDSIAKALGALKDVPPAVRTFMAKASKREAVLEDLTPDVSKWLKDHDMLALIRIGFK